MIFRKLWHKSKGQAGFTLIEVIAALAITGVLTLGAAIASIQVMNQGSRNSDYTTASRNAMNAVYWISCDAQMSQVIDPGGASGFPLALRWTEWDNSEHEVVYSIEEDSKLVRSYSIDAGGTVETLVAQYINAVGDNTTCDFTGGKLAVKITSIVGEGARAINVTKVREIAPRPGL